MDETRLDVAPTPAHVFAYRAFRSVFVHSPESSPIKPAATFDRYNDNKENARLSPVRSSRFATSPTKTKRKDAGTELADIALNLTPKRQKTIPISPTKSILKNPNAPTPRRAELRDATVTFKDLRKSVSPELARQSSPRRVRSQPEFDVSRSQKLVKDVMPMQVVTEPRPSMNETYQKPKLLSMNVVQPTSSFDLDAYKMQTEKEMRRLIKYGQKWKEQARRQEEENAKVKSLLEIAQQENERLQKKLDGLCTDRDKSQRTTQQKSRRGDETSKEAPLRQKEEAFYDFLLEESNVKTRSQTKAAQNAHADGNHGLERKPSITKHYPQHQRPVSKTSHNNSQPKLSSTAAAHQHLQDLPTRPKERPQPNNNDNSNNKAGIEIDVSNQNNPTKPQPSIGSTKTTATEKVVLPTRSASTSAATAVVEDRRAAARARLEKRRMARTASAQVVSSASPLHDTRKGRDSSKLEVEESQVDWLAMV